MPSPSLLISFTNAPTAIFNTGLEQPAIFSDVFDMGSDLMSPPQYTVEDQSCVQIPEHGGNLVASGLMNPPDYSTTRQGNSYSAISSFEYPSTPAEQIYHVSSQTHDPSSGRRRTVVESYGARALLSAWSALRGVGHNVVSGHECSSGVTTIPESFDNRLRGVPRRQRPGTFHEDDQPSYAERMDTWLDVPGGDASGERSTPSPNGGVPRPPLPRRSETSPAALPTIEENPPLRCGYEVNGITCEKSYAGKWKKTALHRHIIEDHVGRLRHHCQVCRNRGRLKSYKRYWGLKKHMRDVHRMDIGTLRPQRTRRRGSLPS